MSEEFVLKVPEGNSIGMTPELLEFIKTHGRIELYGTIRVPGDGLVTELNGENYDG